MSYILDALKKSEEERKRGNLPDLSSQNLKIPKQRATNIWPAVGMGMLAINMAVIGWLFLREPKNDATENSVNHEVEQKPVVAAPVPPVTQPLQQSQPIQVPQMAQTMPQQVIVVPAGAVAPGQVVTIPQTVSAQTMAGQPIVVYAAPQQAQIAQQQLQPQHQTGSQVLMPGDPAPMQVTSAAQPQSVFIAPGQGDISSPNSDIDEKAVPDINQLPDTIKRGLPELSFSSHMYSSDPTFRKVIINGKQLRENQPLNVDIMLKRITDDGVVLDYQGTLFKVNVVEQWSYQN